MEIIRIQQIKGTSSVGVIFSALPEYTKYYAEYTRALGLVQEKRYDTICCWFEMSQADAEKIKSIVEERITNNTAVIKQLETQKNPAPQKEKNVTVDIDVSTVGDCLKLPPYQYQRECIKFCLETKNCLLCLPCGAGKSLTVIAVYLEALKRKYISGPAIIVVKASLKTQWKAEVEKFSNLNTCIIRTLSACNKKQEEYESQFGEYDVYITNYEALRDEDINKRLLKLKPQFIAADEIHFVKDNTTKRAKALYKFNKIIYRVGATATPLQKNPLDIFGVFKFLDASLFPTKTMFSNNYVRFGRFNQVIGSKNEKYLNEKIAPYMIVKNKEEISSQLPQLVVLQRWCDFTPAQNKKNLLILQKIDDLRAKQTKVKDPDREKQIAQLDAQIMAYQQYAQEFADDERLLEMSESKEAKKYMTKDKSQKLELLVDTVKEIITSGEKVAIFSRYRRMQDIFIERFEKESELKDVIIAVVNGSLNSARRYEEVYTKFKDDPDCKILLLTEAGQEGLNLSECQYLIEYDLAQSYAAQTQRHGRVERADSTHSTSYVIQLLVRGSYDEIQRAIIDKKEKYDAAIVKGVSFES